MTFTAVLFGIFSVAATVLQNLRETLKLLNQRYTYTYRSSCLPLLKSYSSYSNHTQVLNRIIP